MNSKRIDLVGAASVIALAIVVMELLFLCGRPLDVTDLWFHIKMGEVYLTEGLWPDGDPMLHTAVDDAPFQHEWLFGACEYGIANLLGLRGVRLVQILSVATIIGLAYAEFHRQSRSVVIAAATACGWLAVTWWRLIQHRPHIFTIFAALLLTYLLLGRENPLTKRRILICVLLFLVWANVHSIFLAGLLLLAAALSGAALHLIIWSRLPEDDKRVTSLNNSTDDGVATDGPIEPYASCLAWAKGLAIALALSALVTLLNPRGWDQHLTFLSYSRSTAIWRIRDEWAHFNPFQYTGYGLSVNLLMWAVLNVVIVLFVIAVSRAVQTLLRHRTRDSLLQLDLPNLALGFAALVAIFTSVRFAWMAYFPLRYLLCYYRQSEYSLSAARRAQIGNVSTAVALGIMAAFPLATNFRRVWVSVPKRPLAYIKATANRLELQFSGVEFLKKTNVEGNLYNSYMLGGYLGYRLSPRLRTFIDGRTEHYSVEVFDEYLQINNQVWGPPGTTFLDLLEKRQVDFFFGEGAPRGGSDIYTACYLERVPGWLLVSRSMLHSIYLRDNNRNRDNKRRIADFYRTEGIPFDDRQGLVIAEIVRTHPIWAVQHGLLPHDYEKLLQAAEKRTEKISEDWQLALDRLAAVHIMIGMYEEQLALDGRLLEHSPQDVEPQLRSIYSLLRLDRTDEASALADNLLQFHPHNGRIQLFAKAARIVTTLRTQKDLGEHPRYAPDLPLNRLRVVTHLY